MRDEETIPEETPAADAPQAPSGPVLQIVFHAPDGTALMGVGYPAAALMETGVVHLPALEVVEELVKNYFAWQYAQPKPSGILVPQGHAQLSVAQQNAEKLQRALEQIRPRPGERLN